MAGIHTSQKLLAVLDVGKKTELVQPLPRLYLAARSPLAAALAPSPHHQRLETGGEPQSTAGAGGETDR